MYKLVGEERFLLWAVCSIQLQVLCANGEDKLLLLAEGLLKKHVAAHSLHEPEALIVYISILEQQAKYGDALEILSGKLGSLLMMEVDRLRIEGRLLARAGDYSAAVVVYQKLLKLCPDDWEGFLHYLSCVLEDDSIWCVVADNNPIQRSKFLDCRVSHLSDEVFDCRTSDASAFVQKLQEDNRDSLIRGPYLAGLEIKRRKHLYGKVNDDEMIEALMQYFSIFGHLACFTSDVEVFLQVLAPNKRTKFNERLVKCYSSLPVDVTKMLGQSITLFKVQDVMGNMYTTLPVSELEDTAVRMVKLFFESLPLFKDLDPQESMQGEELLSLTCNVLVQLFWRTRHLGYLVEAIMVLEFGLTIRRYVWQYKILLVHLYSFLGALSLAYEWYKLLDVKNILMETVSHHMLPQMLKSPLWVELNNLLKDYLRFMDDYFRESADLTFLAYRHRNYSKVIEFVQFKEHLQRSNQYLVARIEAAILQLKQNADNLEEEELVLESLNCGIQFAELSNEIRPKSLTFNEDLQSRPWWTPISGKNYLLGPFEGISYCPKENLTKENEASVRRAIERRALLPRMVHLSIQSASALLKDNMEVNGSVSDPQIYSELKFLLERYAKLLGCSLSDAIEVVMGGLNSQKSSEVFHSDMVDWMNFAVFLNAWKLCSNERKQLDRDGCAPGIWRTVNSLLEKYISEVVKSMEPLIHPSRGDLSFLVQVISEPLAWHILVIQSYVRSSLPSGKKKKKGGSTDHSTSPLAIVTRDTIQLLCAILEEVTRWLGEQIKGPEDENLEIILSSVRKESQVEGPGQVFQILGTLISSTSEMEVGVRICEALKSWNPVDVARKMATGQSLVLSEFLYICESRMKSLQLLKHQIAQV
ncbi:N-terminal acetyltransferase B complex auxiliary subunit NAA25-like isoform X2 [Tripterygium wilfordii]|nr:N-terminal acetyltransferase B complex auxiliary subunit NAA25-like isoform X2 [Tripterygium wilfordii]